MLLWIYFYSTIITFIVMPPRTTEVGRGFPTFRARNSIICRYGPGLVPSPRRKKGHTPVNCRQVRVHRRHGQELLPFPWHQILSDAGFYWRVTIYAQAATGRPLLTTDHNVFNVRCGVAGNPLIPALTYSRRKNLAPMFWAADRSQLYILPFWKVHRL